MTHIPRRPQEFVLPAHLPGEDEYGVFIHHVHGCADCGYGQAFCDEATKLWRAYRTAKKSAKRRT